MKRYISLFIFILIFSAFDFGQNYSVDRDAFGIPPFNNACPSDTCFTLTPDLLWQAGAVYSQKRFDLTQPFDGTFCLFLGTKDANGADGFAFVLKDTNTATLGLLGGGIGFGSLLPSVAIEFDTWDNGGADIFADHTSLNYNGNNLVPIVPSIPLLPSGANVEDGLPHTARIVWIPTDTTLYMYFDNVLRFTHKVDLINTVFGGKTKVDWGFTSSTGGSSNLQQICFPSKQTITYYDTICQNQCLDFVQEIKDSASNYSWNNGISDTVPATRICTDTSARYLLFKQNKLTRIIDTIILFIEVDSIPVFELGKDTNFCEGTLKLDASSSNAQSYLWNDGSDSSSIYVNDTGTYWVEIKTDFCTVKDTINILCLELPNVFTPNNDGINDYFSPIKLSGLFQASFLIYNRWGSVVYESTDLNEIKKGWDGRFGNKECLEGVYFYTLEYQFSSKKEKLNLKGSVSLFR